MTSLSALLALVATTCAKKIKVARKDVLPGTHTDFDVTVTVRVGGDTETYTITGDELAILPDETYPPTIKIPVMATLALALRQAGVTRDALKAHLVSAARDALAAGEKVGDALELQEDLDDAMDQVRATMDALPPATRKGKVLLKKARVTSASEVAKAAK